MSTKKFLFFLYYYPPARGTAVNRNKLISGAIFEKYNAVTIFTASKNLIHQQGPLSVESIPVYDYRSIIRRKTLDGAIPENKKAGIIAQIAIKLVNSFPINILFGEGGLIYFLNLLRKGRKTIKNENITHLYSSYRPFADHYAAYWLKKSYPHLYWIADFRDLMIDPHFNRIYFQKAHHWFFKKLFSQANLLTTVSEGLAKQLKQYNPRSITLRNGIEDHWQPALPTPIKHFSVVYTGSMFLDKRNPEPVFRALSKLIQESKITQTDLQIIYAGKDSASWNQLATRYHLESIFIDKGIISEEEAKQLQQQAGINLLLTISSDQLQGVLTGKLTEYIKAGSPLLGIIVGQNDPEIQMMLSELEIGDSFSDQAADEEAVKEFVYSEYLKWKSTGFNRKPVNLEVVKLKYALSVTMDVLYAEIEKSRNE